MAFVQFYTGQGIRWDDAVKNVHAGEGSLFTCVVEAIAKRATEPSLNYGFFYRHNDGTLADCLQVSKAMLKTANTAEVAMSFLIDAYPGYWGFSLPVLSEANLVRPGEITDQTMLTWSNAPRLGDDARSKS